jgi:hypothetical protein
MYDCDFIKRSVVINVDRQLQEMLLYEFNWKRWIRKEGWSHGVLLGDIPASAGGTEEKAHTDICSG